MKSIRSIISLYSLEENKIMFKVQKKTKVVFVYNNFFDLPENTQWVFVNANGKMCVSFKKAAPDMGDRCFTATDALAVCEVKLGESDWKESLAFVGDQVLADLSFMPKAYQYQDEDSMYDKGYYDGYNGCLEDVEENLHKLTGKKINKI